MRIFWIFVAALLIAAPAFAIDTSKFPHVLMDSTCTDTKSVIGGFGFGTTFVQTSGTTDGFCDHDSRILAGPITDDTTFGPFHRIALEPSVFIFVDADVVSNDTDTWRIVMLHPKPNDGTLVVVGTFATQSTEGDKTFANQPNNVDIGVVTGELTGIVPPNFYIKLELLTATSWDGSISWFSY